LRWFKLLTYKGRYQSREAKAFCDWLRGAAANKINTATAGPS